ncbi:MAG: hypothetical protein WCA98_11770, partial [Candidatus Acidiferrales bacterium]
KSSVSREEKNSGAKYRNREKEIGRAKIADGAAKAGFHARVSALSISRGILQLNAHESLKHGE